MSTPRCASPGGGGFSNLYPICNPRSISLGAMTTSRRLPHPPVVSYVVRVYRTIGASRERLVGTVEGDDLPGKRGFTSAEELWEIFTPKQRSRSESA